MYKNIKIPDEYICPITHSIMIDPVICNDHYTYKRLAIMRAFQYKSISPMTRQADCQITGENNVIKNKIKEFLIENNVYQEE